MHNLTVQQFEIVHLRVHDSHLAVEVLANVAPKPHCLALVQLKMRIELGVRGEGERERGREREREMKLRDEIESE